MEAESSGAEVDVSILRRLLHRNDDGGGAADPWEGSSDTSAKSQFKGVEDDSATTMKPTLGAPDQRSFQDKDPKPQPTKNNDKKEKKKKKVAKMVSMRAPAPDVRSYAATIGAVGRGVENATSADDDGVPWWQGESMKGCYKSRAVPLFQHAISLSLSLSLSCAITIGLAKYPRLPTNGSKLISEFPLPSSSFAR